MQRNSLMMTILKIELLATQKGGLTVAVPASGRSCLTSIRRAKADAGQQAVHLRPHGLLRGAVFHNFFPQGNL